MNTSTGEIDLKSGNEARSEIIKWCLEHKYRDTGQEHSFDMVNVEINPIDYHKLRCAVEIRIELSSTIQGRDGLQLKADLLEFAKILEERFEIVLDRLHGDARRIQIDFRAPDGQRILPKEKGG